MACDAIAPRWSATTLIARMLAAMCRSPATNMTQSDPDAVICITCPVAASCGVMATLQRVTSCLVNTSCMRGSYHFMCCRCLVLTLLGQNCKVSTSLDAPFRIPGGLAMPNEDDAFVRCNGRQRQRFQRFSIIQVTKFIPSSPLV